MGARRILITGAGGFVGAAAVKAAAAAGHDVIALVRNDSSRLREVPGIQIERVDLAEAAAVTDLLQRTCPDVVIHSAWEGVGGPLRSGDIQFDNVRTTVALADSAIAAGATKFVGIGSQAEYGRFDRRIVETDLPQPTMLYGAAKLAAMHLASQRCREAGVAFAWLRLFSVYGPGDNPNWLIPSVAASLVRGIAPKCTAGTQTWDYLHIDDVAEGVLAAAVSEDATGVFNLSSGTSIAVRSIIEKLRDIAAPELDLQFGEIPFGADQIMRLEGDNTRLRTAAKWEPKVRLKDGLQQVVNDFRVFA